MIVRSLALAVLCATAFANPGQDAHKEHSKSLEASSECTRKYKIIEGDTCDKISARNSVSTHQIAHANKKINDGCTNLVIGDTLCLGLKGQDCTKVYVVSQGDICFSVAKKAGIPLDVLFKNNPNINKGCTNIYPGEVLCVAPTANTTDSSVSGIKGLPHFTKFPLHNSSSNSSTENVPFRLPSFNLTQSSAHRSGSPTAGHGPFGLPPINLTDSIAHLKNITHKAFNASSISSFLNSTFPALNLTNSSSPVLGTPNNTFTLPPLPHLNRTRNKPFPSFNLTDSDSLQSSTSATGGDSGINPNPNPTIPLDGGFTLPQFAPSFPTRSSDDSKDTARTPTSAPDGFGFSGSTKAIGGDGPFGSASDGFAFPFPTITNGDPNTPTMPF